jgi:sugar phosphate isomerase/epimerase
MRPVGLQLHTLREQMEKDYFGTLDEVARIGYTGIELGGRLPYSASQMKTRLDLLGLTVIAVHTLTDTLTGGITELIEFCQTLDCKYIVLSWAECDSLEHIGQTANVLNEAGKTCHHHGIQLCYHNHAHEFVRYGGEYALDILLNATEPDFVKMELDTYWVKKGGEDPVRYLRKLKGRCPLVHFKDMEKGESEFFAEVGEGKLDFAEIAQAAEDAGATWFVVEQDESRGSPLDSISLSYRNLLKMGLAEQ